MASQQMMISAASSSSSSSLLSLKKYDVFLSFRGEDTRRNFTSHLYDALNRNKIITFIDDNELQKGDSISPTLTTAIEESYISIVIFSENYASSKWCLYELIKILKCKMIVIPVFYNIDPSHVRKQTGSYQQAFAKHELDMKLNKDMLQKWKDALFKAAGLAGYDTLTYKNDADLIKIIVEYVLQKLKPIYPFEVKERGLVGIEQKYEEMKSLLEMGSNDVRSLAVWGMGGIGKTTLVEVLSAKLYSQFEGYCFLQNVREESQKYGLVAVRNRLFSALLEEKNLRHDALCVETQSIMRRLLCKKLLIVLDDVATSKQMEHLMLDNNFLGQGSRVIVTTRDMQIIRHNVHAIYEVKELNESDSLELFCFHAFREKHPKIGYEELSKSAISYCQGNPLALKVSGARLGSKSKMAWESDLKKLQSTSDGEIHNVLKLSYDDLEPTEKDIFLDIACFFREWDINRVIPVLEACNFFARPGIEVLLGKALITISCNVRGVGQINMHDLIAEMGRKIVNQESIKEPGERSRLWNDEEVADVLKNNKGTKAVEGIRLDTRELVEDLFLSSDSFKRMTNLRYLVINQKFECKVYLPDGLEWLSDKLRYLKWNRFPLDSLPSTFCAKMLVELHLKDSKLKKLWDGVQNLFNLKLINMSHSVDLIEMPDLSSAINLEVVYLDSCHSLCELHPHVLSLPKLKELRLWSCKKIKSLKSNIHSKSLCILGLSGCSSLVEFSVTSEAMTWLDLCNTAIRELSSSIWRNSKLEALQLWGCRKLSIIGKKLSNDPGISSLKELNLRGCTQMDALNLSFLLDGIQSSSLERLPLSDCCNLETLPHNIHKHLKALELNGCTKLVLSSLMEQLPPYLQYFSAVNLSNTPRLLLENMLQTIFLNRENNGIQEKNNLSSWSCREQYNLFMPGDQVPDTFRFQGRGNSVIIPHIPKSNLKGFFFCVLLPNSKGIKNSYAFFPKCFIYEHGKLVGKGDHYNMMPFKGSCHEALISDHVWVWWYEYYSMRESGGGDHYNIEFKFQWKKGEDTDGIKGCGVLPVYDKSSNHRVEIVELESTAQPYDVDHQFEGRAIRDDDDDDQQQPSYYSKEDEENFNEKSSCDCSIGLLLEHDDKRRVEIVELESNTQVCDVHEFELARAIGDDDQQQQPSCYPKENEQEFYDKSSCDCSIDSLDKYVEAGHLENDLVESEVNSNTVVEGVAGNFKHDFDLNKVPSEAMSTDESVVPDEVVPTNEGVADALNMAVFDLNELSEEQKVADWLEKNESEKLKKWDDDMLKIYLEEGEVISHHDNGVEEVAEDSLDRNVETGRLENDLVESEVNSNTAIEGVAGNFKHDFDLNKVPNDESVVPDEVVPTNEGVADALNIPVFDLNELSEKIVELESTAKACDVDHQFEAGAIRDDDQQQPSYYPKEDEENFNKKSSCDCSIGLLLKHLLGESNRMFLQFFKHNKTTS